MADEIVVAKTPSGIVNEGIAMAKTLQTIVMQRKGGLVVNGKRYLQYEDWQTLARFFGLTVKTGNVEVVEINGRKGVKAKAEVLNSVGALVGSAEAFCMDDEKKWTSKPFFQKASMAQTRAGAKALRNLLGWVAVLGGFAGTPAEEIDGEEEHKVKKYTYKDPNAKASDKQTGAIYAIAGKVNISKDIMKAYIKKVYDIGSMKDLTTKQAGDIITILNNTPSIITDVLEIK